MAIATLQQMLIRTLLVIGFISLAACGGGGGGSDNAGSSSVNDSDTSVSSASTANSVSSPNSASSVSSSISVNSVPSSSSSSSVANDSTPDAFTFPAMEDAALSAEITSGEVIVSGINIATAISITNGEYAIDNGAFTSDAGTVTVGQSIVVKVTAAATTNTPVEAVLTIGGVSATFVVTTLADTTPDAFSFEPSSVIDVAPGSENISNEITVTGFDGAIPITITDGEYSIDGDTYTATAGTISAGQTVTVKTIAPDTTDETKIVELTIGGVSATYSVITYPDEVAPTATIDFPLPSTATIAETITIRGTAADDFNTVAGLTVQITGAATGTVAATSEDGFATWQAVIPLVDGANTLTLIAEDSQENINEEAAQVVVHKQAFTAAFPNNDVDISNMTAMTLDKTNNRAFVMKQNPWAMVSVDLVTGERSIFSSETIPNTQNLPGVSNGIAMDIPRNRALIAGSGGTVYDVSLADEDAGVRTLLSSSTVPTDTQPALTATYGIAIDPDNSNVAYVLGQNSRNLARMNITTGERTLVSDNNMPDTGVLFSVPRDVEVDKDGQNAWVVEQSGNNIRKVNLTTGVREELGAGGYPDTGFGFRLNSIVSNNERTHLWAIDRIAGLLVYDIAEQQWSVVWPFQPNVNFSDVLSGYVDLDEENHYIIFADRETKGVYAVDLVTSEMVIISKSGL